MLDINKARSIIALTSLGDDSNNDNIEQMAVLLEVFKLYVQRSEQHGQTWKELGALNNLARLVTKTNRLKHQFWDKHEVLRAEFPEAVEVEGSPTEDLDDALDAINYLVFFIRQARLGQWTSGPDTE
jgi:hypothetical protein